MPKATTQSFVTETLLKMSSYEQAILQKRFWVAKQETKHLGGAEISNNN